jgi:Flp pilus assembly protein TadG
MRAIKLFRDESGQLILPFATLLTVVVLFAGLSLDAGILYITKARLSNAVDSACMTAVKNLYQGQSTAAAVATNVFNANFGNNAPTPAVTFPTDAYGNQEVNVTATANVTTLFIGILSRFKVLPVNATATATRGNLVMTVVLDRSGSMCGGTNKCDPGVTGDNGGVALQSAVPAFVGDFDNTTDQVGMVSFSSNASIDVPIGYNFITNIDNAVAAMKFTGGTFGTGAGTGSLLSTTQGPPMSLAKLQNDSITGQPGQNIVRVVVYVTDGLMNTIQDNFACPSTTLINYGGHDSGSQVDMFDPGAGTDWGHYTSGTGFPYDTKGDICKSSKGQIVTKFPSQQSGTQVAFSQSAVTTEAQYRAIQTAISMRTESPIPTFVFTIGVGSGLTSSTQAFLAQLANDPSYSTYITGQPAGLFFYIPNCPSTACTTDVQQAFQTIAAKVMLRLTQ